MAHPAQSLAVTLCTALVCGCATQSPTQPAAVPELKPGRLIGYLPISERINSSAILPAPPVGAAATATDEAVRTAPRSSTSAIARSWSINRHPAPPKKCTVWEPTAPILPAIRQLGRCGHLLLPNWRPTGRYRCSGVVRLLPKAAWCAICTGKAIPSKAVLLEPTPTAACRPVQSSGQTCRLHARS